MKKEDYTVALMLRTNIEWCRARLDDVGRRYGHKEDISLLGRSEEVLSKVARYRASLTEFMEELEKQFGDI